MHVSPKEGWWARPSNKRQRNRQAKTQVPCPRVVSVICLCCHFSFVFDSFICSALVIACFIVHCFFSIFQLALCLSLLVSSLVVSFWGLHQKKLNRALPQKQKVSERGAGARQFDWLQIQQGFAVETKLPTCLAQLREIARGSKVLGAG